MIGTTVRRCALGAAALVAALSVAGCETLPVTATVGRGDVREAIARGQLTSPRAATVSLVSLEGAPEGVAARFTQALDAAAAHREITLTDGASARYLLRGYLSAFQDESGATIAYTYDVFDAKTKRREQRVADTLVVPSSGSDPWSALTASALDSLAGQCADDLAVALAGTPEAQAAGGKLATAAPASTTVR